LEKSFFLFLFLKKKKTKTKTKKNKMQEEEEEENKMQEEEEEDERLRLPLYLKVQDKYIDFSHNCLTEDVGEASTFHFSPSRKIVYFEDKFRASRKTAYMQCEFFKNTDISDDGLVSQEVFGHVKYIYYNVSRNFFECCTNPIFYHTNAVRIQAEFISLKPLLK
jgi:hypothetical protein